MRGRRVAGLLKRRARFFLTLSCVFTLVALGCSASDEAESENEANTDEDSVEEASNDSDESDGGDSDGDERFVVEAEAAPEAIGPYSQAVGAGETLFLSGQIPMDPESGDVLVDEDITAQTHQVLTNLEAVVEEAGLTLDDVVSTSVFMVDLDEFDAMNDTYAEYFGDEPPARATVEVSSLPAGASVEISAIVHSP